MEPFGIVHIKIFPESVVSVDHCRIFLNVNIPVFYRTPKSLDKNIIENPASPVHANPDFCVQQLLRKIERRELYTLIVVKDIRPPVTQGFLEAFHAKRRIQCIAEPPGQNITAEPIHDGHQITEPASQLDIRDVSRPNLIGSDNLDASEQIRVNPMLRVLLAQPRLWINRQQVHRPHQPADEFLSGGMAQTAYVVHHFNDAAWIVHELLVDGHP